MQAIFVVAKNSLPLIAPRGNVIRASFPLNAQRSRPWPLHCRGKVGGGLLHCIRKTIIRPRKIQTASKIPLRKSPRLCPMSRCDPLYIYICRRRIPALRVPPPNAIHRWIWRQESSQRRTMVACDEVVQPRLVISDSCRTRTVWPHELRVHDPPQTWAALIPVRYQSIGERSDLPDAEPKGCPRLPDALVPIGRNRNPRRATSAALTHSVHTAQVADQPDGCGQPQRAPISDARRKTPNRKIGHTWRNRRFDAV